MEGMFFYAYAFDQEIYMWDTSLVFSMNRMFLAASAFQRDLRLWCVDKVFDGDYFAYAHTTGIYNPPNFGFCATRPATASEAASVRPSIIVSVTTTAAYQVVCFPFSRAQVVDAIIDFDDGTAPHVIFSNTSTCVSPYIAGLSHLFITPGDYQVRIYGQLDHFGGGDPSTGLVWGDALRGVTFVNDTGLLNLAGAFMGATANFNISTTIPCRVQDMSWAFYNTLLFNNPIGEWDTSSVTSMEGMFFYAFAFHQDISHWDTFNVANMNRMFLAASAFQRDIRMWCVGNVIDADYFDYAHTAGIYNPPNFGSCSSAIAGTSPAPSTPNMRLFITTSSANQVVCIPFARAYNVRLWVDFSDGSTPIVIFNNQSHCNNPFIPGVSHLFQQPGDYVVTLAGSLDHFGAGDTSFGFSWGDALRGLNFSGHIGLQSLAGAFIGATYDFSAPESIPCGVQDLSVECPRKISDARWQSWGDVKVCICAHKGTSKILKTHVSDELNRL
jgi:hypothetical protein